MCHQNVTETQATEYLKSTHREAGLAISMLHTGLSSARRKEADETGALAPIAVARSDRPGDFNTGNVSSACGYPYRAVHPSV